MRTLAFLLTVLFLGANGCVISPRRTVAGSGGGGSSEFSLSANPTSQNITAGASATYAISVQPVNGFSGVVTLSASSTNASVVASLDTTTINGGSGSATLTVQTTSTTPSGTITVTVTAADTSNNVSQNIAVTASVLSAASMAGASVQAAGAVIPAGWVNIPAGSGAQRVSFPTTPGTDGFTVTFDLTPSLATMDATLGFLAPASSGPPALSPLIDFSPAGVIRVRDGETFVPSNVPYAAGETYHFRLVGNLPAATYSVFVTPPGAPEVPLGTNLQVSSDQRGAKTLTGWGMLANAPDGATLGVGHFSLR
jgi:hypothetical protein